MPVFYLYILGGSGEKNLRLQISSASPQSFRVARAAHPRTPGWARVVSSLGPPEARFKRFFIKRSLPRDTTQLTWCPSETPHTSDLGVMGGELGRRMRWGRGRNPVSSVRFSWRHISFHWVRNARSGFPAHVERFTDAGQFFPDHLHCAALLEDEADQGGRETGRR
jgi:hypothetical protein